MLSPALETMVPMKRLTADDLRSIADSAWDLEDDIKSWNERHDCPDELQIEASGELMRSAAELHRRAHLFAAAPALERALSALLVAARKARIRGRVIASAEKALEDAQGSGRRISRRRPRQPRR